MKLKLHSDVNETYIHVTDRDIDFFVLPLVNINVIVDNAIAEVIYVTPCCKEESSLIDWDEIGQDELFCSKCEEIIPHSETMPVSVFLDRESDELATQAYYELHNDIFESIIRAASIEHKIRELVLSIEAKYNETAESLRARNVTPDSHLLRSIVLSMLAPQAI